MTVIGLKRKRISKFIILTAVFFVFSSILFSASAYASSDTASSDTEDSARENSADENSTNENPGPSMPYRFDVIDYDMPDFSYRQKNITFDGTGYFFMRRIDYKTSKNNYITSFYIPGNTGTVRWLASDGQFDEKPLADGYLPLDTFLYISTERYHMILGQGYSYRDLGNATKEHIPYYTRQIRIKKVGDRWLVTYTFPQRKDSHGIMWGIGSHKKLVDFNDESIKRWWHAYDVTENARLCEDGYYYKSPVSYVPTSESSYWRIPSMYLINSLAKYGRCLADDMMVNAMLTIASDNINEEGYLPTQPESNWLMTDYGIGGGFFDTRFNADTIETYIKAYQKYKHELFRDSFLKLSDYYIKHIEEQHYKVGEAQEGWLVEDYAHIEYPADTHVSLNHQLQGIHIMLLLYEQEKNEYCLELARKMLEGIRQTKALWVMENSNLEYAYKADGEMGYVDYPFLTYNDLFTVQNVLERICGEKDETLDYLMDMKKQWMDANGITGYLGHSDA